MAMKLRMPTDFGHALPGSRDGVPHFSSPLFPEAVRMARQYTRQADRLARGVTPTNDFYMQRPAYVPQASTLTEESLGDAIGYFLSLRDEVSPMEPPREKVLDAAVARIVHEVVNEEIPGHPVYDGPPLFPANYEFNAPGAHLLTMEEYEELKQVQDAITENFRQRNGGDSE